MIRQTRLLLQLLRHMEDAMIDSDRKENKETQQVHNTKKEGGKNYNRETQPNMETERKNTRTKREKPDQAKRGGGEKTYK